MQFAEEKATVCHIDGEFVFLETQNNASCNNCSSKSGCSQVSSIFTYKLKNKLKLNNTLKLKQGDEVIIGMPVDKLLKATVLMYLSPLLVMFSFSLIAKLALGETASVIAGLLGLSAGLLFVNQFSRQKFILNQFQPTLIRKTIKLEPA